MWYCLREMRQIPSDSCKAVVISVPKLIIRKNENSAANAGPYIVGRGGGGGGVGRGGGGQLPPPGKLNFVCNIVFEFAELFLVAILVQNHKNIDWLT